MDPVLNEVKDIGAFLKENGIKPSYQRMQIYKFLLENRIHPTVDTIYKALCDDIPTLSKTTIYNTLNTFVEKGIISVIVIEENETRYEANMQLHGHFKCTECGQIYDIFLDTDPLDLTQLKNFKIKEKHIYFKGICEHCLKKATDKN
ncbi:Fur family transcriptional regulator [Fusobacterium sp.]|uniref:Fur family transcriptional regulator n=1 Tax=Fusobacterium sp. TaxID=68766 RepID=UPI002624FB7D|nr:Fur family transcriptional regulator [Fusobacterium sp.]